MDNIKLSKVGIMCTTHSEPMSRYLRRKLLKSSVFPMVPYRLSTPKKTLESRYSKKLEVDLVQLCW